MKASLLFSAILASALVITQASAATDPIGSWYAELTDVQQSSHQNIGGRVRADTILRAVLDASQNGLVARESSGRPAESPPTGANLKVAAAHSAYSVLAVLYPQNLPALDERLAQSLSRQDDSAAAVAAGKEWGKHVAEVVLADQSDAVFLNPRSFAAEANAPDIQSSLPEQHAEQPEIGPGRYRFSVLAGAPGTSGYLDGSGGAARFNQPGGMAVDTARNLYLSDKDRATIRKVSPEGVVTTLAGNPGQRGSQDGTGPAAQFNQPTGLAVDDAGNVYVADTGNHTIRKIDPLGRVTTVVGIAGERGGQDGPKESARLDQPASLTLDASGNLLVVEPDRIRKVATDGSVTTSVAIPNLAGFWPISLQKIQADPAGNLYVTYLHSGPMEDLTDVLKLTPQASTSDYRATALMPPGSVGYMVHGDGVDETGRVFITGYGDPTYVYTPDGNWQIRYPAERMERAWDYPGNDIAVGPSGELYVFHSGEAFDGTDNRGIIEVGVFDPAATGPVIIESPSDQFPHRGENAKFEVQAVGGPTLTFQWYLNSNPIAAAIASSLVLQNVGDQNVGSYSVVVSDGGGSVASRSAKLVVTEKVSSGIGTATGTSGAGSGTSPGSTGSASARSGGGSFDAGISLAVLSLLAAAMGHRGARATSVHSRGGRGFNIAAKGSGFRKERT